jgi:hypothetical protein
MQRIWIEVTWIRVSYVQIFLTKSCSVSSCVFHIDLILLCILLVFSESKWKFNLLELCKAFGFAFMLQFICDPLHIYIHFRFWYVILIYMYIYAVGLSLMGPKPVVWSTWIYEVHRLTKRYTYYTASYVRMCYVQRFNCLYLLSIFSIPRHWPRVREYACCSFVCQK